MGILQRNDKQGDYERQSQNDYCRNVRKKNLAGFWRGEGKKIMTYGNSYIKKNLPVVLTSEELLAISRDLAKANQDLSSILNQKKEMNASYGAKQKMSEGLIEDLSLKISTGQEYRDVECKITFDEKSLRKIVCRTDTGEIVERVKMTTEDFQTELEFYGSNQE